MPYCLPGQTLRKQAPWRSLNGAMTGDAAPRNLDLDLLAASLRADTGDLGAYVESLAAKLEEAVPGRVRVYRWRERLFGPKRVGKIALDAGERRLELTYQGGALEARAAKTSGGIVIKNETIDVEAWVAALSATLAAEAARSDRTRQALERLLTD
jgi:hypothetical protein